MTTGDTPHGKNPEDTNILSQLQDNSLYVLLYHHPNPEIKYHWGLYHHLDATRGGWKFDITDTGGSWHLAIPYQLMPRDDVLPHPNPLELLACMIRVGELHCDTAVGEGAVFGSSFDLVHSLIRADDTRLDDINAELAGRLSCRVYVQRACHRLRQKKLLKYNAWSDLEVEVLRHGNENGKQRRDKGVMTATVFDYKVAGF